MTTPDTLPADAFAARDETNIRWASYQLPATLTDWTTVPIDDGLMLSAQVSGPNPGEAVARFADRFSGYLRRHAVVGLMVRMPQLDVSVEGRTAVRWCVGRVWVELWYPEAGPTPKPVPSAARKPLRHRFQFTRRPKTLKETTV